MTALVRSLTRSFISFTSAVSLTWARPTIITISVLVIYRLFYFLFSYISTSYHDKIDGAKKKCYRKKTEREGEKKHDFQQSSHSIFILIGSCGLSFYFIYDWGVYIGMFDCYYFVFIDLIRQNASNFTVYLITNWLSYFLFYFVRCSSLSLSIVLSSFLSLPFVFLFRVSWLFSSWENFMNIFSIKLLF